EVEDSPRKKAKCRGVPFTPAHGATKRNAEAHSGAVEADAVRFAKLAGAREVANDPVAPEHGMPSLIDHIGTGPDDQAIRADPVRLAAGTARNGAKVDDLDARSKLGAQFCALGGRFVAGGENCSTCEYRQGDMPYMRLPSAWSYDVA